MCTTIEVAGHLLPGAWRYMLPEEFTWLRLPRERRATCAECPRILTKDYRADCRCCTYFPHLPNFMLGLGLLDERTRDTMMPLITGGFAVPEGTPITPARLQETTALYVREAFGRNRGLICPLVSKDGARCGIYPYRNSVCATFFCEADHGALGIRYWEKVQALLGQVETALAQWCMGEVGIDVDAYMATLDAFEDALDAVTDTDTGAWSEEARRALFGEWFGRETRFFEQCAELVMDHRGDLYGIACRQTLRVAFGYERAVEAALPEQQLAEIDPLPKNPGDPIPIETLWYQLQLATKRLWELPFNEAEVGRHPDVAILDNPRDDVLANIHGDKPHFVVVPREPDDTEPAQRLFLSEAEASVLALFDPPQIIGESLLERPELTALDDAKGFLAECMRRRILVSQ